MIDTLREMKQISSELLQERLEPVRVLREDELELYEISKDRETGEHYLHYAYIHRNVAAAGPGAGETESFHHLLPISSDEVLGLLFNDDAYAYPEHWHKPFLRNGPDGSYVWFDPGYVDEQEASEALAQQIAEEIARLKSAGDLSPQAVESMLKRLKQEDQSK